MNAFDLAILGVIALSAIFAFARGLVREALSIVAWLGAAAITYYLYVPARALVARFVDTPLVAEGVAIAGVFIVSLIVLTIVTGYIASLVRYSALSPIDRTLGLLFGLARGVALASLAYLLLDYSLSPTDRPAFIREAKSTPLLAQGADVLRRILPESLKLRGAALVDEGQRTFDQATEAQRAMRALSSPAAPPGNSSAGNSSTGNSSAGSASAGTQPSYKQNDRSRMDQLIQSNQ